MKTFLGTISCVAMFASGCGGFEIESAWRRSVINVDGGATDWDGLLAFNESARADLGVVNDADHLYICMIPRDRTIETQIMRGGMTLWFDPLGGDGKTFGIRFPLGLAVAPPPSGEMPDRNAMLERSPMPDRAQLVSRFLASLTHLDVISAGDTVRMAIDGESAIQVRIGVTPRQTIIYEARLLLSAARITLAPTGGGWIGIGFETPQVDSEPKRRDARDAGRIPGGRARPGGAGGPGRGPGGPGRMGGRRPTMPEPLNAWGTLHLATRG